MQVRDFDKFIGLEVFSTKTPGVGGRLRRKPEDFIVQEIGLDGQIAPLESTTKEYPDQPGKFIAFFLVKRNIDSIQAVRQLAKRLGISYKRFSYAGIKDRRALTSQRVTLYRASPQDVIGYDSHAIKVLHPHRVPRPIIPGGLIGNQFTIIIHDLDESPKTVMNRLQRIQAEIDDIGGLLNFFGHQRFGIMRPTTHLIGKQLVFRDFEKAVQLLLSKDAEEHLAHETPNQEEEMKSQHASGTYERAISHYLAKHPGDYVGCFKVLPKDLARLYVHGYQSYLFNRIISERTKRGLPLQEPLIGDFIMPITGKIYAVRMVTSDTLEQAKKRVQKRQHIIVIPILGYDFEHINFEGEMGEIISKILKKEQVSPSRFRFQKLPLLSSRGSFRRLLITLQKLHLEYLTVNEEFAVKMQFNLIKGSYASVVLREFMKPKLPTQL